ncbi:MAG: phosphoribosylamine--glycine ligase [Alphaproteobacteria bacterium]|nr:phosphoribosylamine--glycine ligase [Alphaproteobacteria bacterium]MBU0795882.1 phosphoribosylamine--glycine ligase [Alphaproteobacteria bacterium]MBU0888582.1 phosphoribosylamine--glycine ligase [Alphaproteobacteria bacterium]MBU1813684.1 phosphoribosylamine--glycine ligase [Alphaproteobacteria bacterium]
MKLLLVGSGGREHALAWALAASPLCDALYCAPGNAGIAQVAECVAIAADDIAGIVGFATEQAIDFVVVGPEAPLVAGLVDALDEAGIKSFGPRKAAAALEGSKGFMKDFCARHNIPTAAYGRFTDIAQAKDFVARQGAPIVVKADGLAAGKGVVVAMTEAEALDAIDMMMGDKAFGAAGAELVIEEFMEGEEASFFALADGETAIPFGDAQDHKRVGDGDTGPNTGGMGAYSPAPIVDKALAARIMAEIIHPTVAGMKAEGTPFTGVLYAGLMITSAGPRLIEYNVRFGDPECQVLMMRLKSDLMPALLATADRQLGHFDLRWHDRPALCVVMASAGYPGSYAKGTEIKGLDALPDTAERVIFHAGTARDEAGRLLAIGGRVLGVTALGADIAAAQEKAYAAIDRIDWAEGFCRRDIGWRALKK